MFKLFRKGKAMSDAKVGPYRVGAMPGTYNTPDGGSVWLPTNNNIACEAIVRDLNSAYRLGREDEKREREKNRIGTVSIEYTPANVQPSPKFKAGDRVMMSNGVAATVVGNDPLKEWETCILPDFCSMSRYWPTDGLTLIPATISRKFIGGPLDGLSFTLDGWTKQTKYTGELHMGSGGAIDFLKTDCGHTYKLGTVNGEQMMVYERGSK